MNIHPGESWRLDKRPWKVAEHNGNWKDAEGNWQYSKLFGKESYDD